MRMTNNLVAGTLDTSRHHMILFLETRSVHKLYTYKSPNRTQTDHSRQNFVSLTKKSVNAFVVSRKTLRGLPATNQKKQPLESLLKQTQPVGKL